MAPGRKRGAKGATTNSGLSLGDLVLAKVKGFPAWPARISRPEDWERVPDPKKYFVQFFGTAEIAFVAPIDIQAFTIESKNKLSARCQGKTVKYFAQAVKEICEAFEDLQERKSSGRRDDTGRAASVFEAPVDDTVDVDSKDGTVTGGLNGETEIKDLDDRGSGLERCSHKQGQMSFYDIKPTISCNADNSLSPVVSPTKRNKLSNDGANLPLKEEVSASSPCNLSYHKKEGFCDNQTEDTVTHSKHSRIVTHMEGSNATEGDTSIGMVTGQTNSSPLVVSSHGKDPHKELTNGQKSKKVAIGTKRKLEGSSEAPKSSSLTALTSSACENENLKDKIQQRLTLGGSMKESSRHVLKSDLNVSGKKVKQVMKDKIHSEVADDRQKDAEAGYKVQDQAELSGKKMRVQLGQGKHNLATNDASHPIKRTKCADMASDAAEGSLPKNRKSDVHDSEAGNKLKRSTSRPKAENCLASSEQAVNFDSNVPSVEDVQPATKRRRGVLGMISGSSALISEEKTGKSSAALKHDWCSDKLKSPVTQSHSKRRAVRLCDDNVGEEPKKTPVHGGSARKFDAPPPASDSTIITTIFSESSIHSQSIRDPGGLGDGPSKEMPPSTKLLNETLSPKPLQNLERPKKEMAAQACHSPAKLESEKISSKEAKPILVSPRRSPLLVAVAKPAVEPLKAINKSSGKVSGNFTQKKAQAGSNKGSGVISDGLNHSQSQATNEKSKPIFSGDRQINTPKSSSRLNDSSLVEGKLMENIILSGERLEASRDDKMSSSIDSKITDSAISMKHLIAAAQAKRKQSLSQNVPHGNSSSLLATTGDVTGGSPSHAFDVQPPLSGSSSMMQLDVQGYHPRTSLASPSSHIHQFSSGNQPDVEEFEERRVSSGNRPAGGSLSGGTEAAVARDAFEGMIETLSRTKESIGRATRLAIDCAKYGIANEVVELLIRKLELEPSFHRRVDLFFLVDSITQCSHSHKGIAGASYIPTVQAALPRLIGAAAPPGAGARENRRQCLKVLRLWLERKILPESLLRHHMDDIGVPNEETSAGAFLRRPSRAERAVDDPIREMDGMFVDEYGSNATFQLPGFLSSRVFEEEEEEEGQDLERSSYKEGGERSPVETTLATGVLETGAATPSDRRHCILEDVDGELEMEDVSGHPKDERPLFVEGSLQNVSQQQDLDTILEAAPNTSTELLYSPEGSPPLPLDSPPPTPPMPSSPPPLPMPPPLPLSPSPPPPPPPPPLSSLPPSLPPPPPGPQLSLLPQPSLIPQPSMVSQHLHPFQSSIPHSSSKLAYQPPLPHEYCGTTSGNQLVQMVANTPQGAHVDAVVRSEMFPQQSPCFAPAGVRVPSGFNPSRSLEYGHNDIYTNSQPAQPSQQFQSGNAPLIQRSFHPAPPPQAPSSHFSYSKPYTLSHPDGSRRYAAEEQWGMPSNELNIDDQRGGWLSGGRTSSCPGPPFPQEGYFRPPLELPPTNNVGFQPSAVNTLPAGAPISGHSGPQMIPPRPGMSSLSCWRPS